MDRNNIPDISQFNHSVDCQIRFNDIDILGHMNNTVYFSFYDTGKAYFFRHLMKERMDWKRVETVIANIDCAYLQPIFFGEDIAVMTRCLEVHEKSFTLQQILVDKKTGVIKSAANTVMVSIDPETMTAIQIPLHWREALENENYHI